MLINLMRSLLCATLLGASAMAAAGIATAEPSEGIVNCGAWPQNPTLELVNYNNAQVSCPTAFEVIDRFYSVREKYATIDSWDCGVLGAAEEDRMGGVVIRCRGSLGELRVQSV